jgi:hypothetical protein
MIIGIVIGLIIAIMIKLAVTIGSQYWATMTIGHSGCLPPRKKAIY